MDSLWSDDKSRLCANEVALRVYSSRLLGQDPSLVLHGGGNTSVKLMQKNVLGEEEEILFVKGSGWDLAKIEEAGFAPVKLEHLKRLARQPQLSDPQMVNELLTHMTRASAPTPSVEAILHAILPYKFVDHTHADALLTITNSIDGQARIREIYGDLVVAIPYVMPGFDLAKLCAEQFSIHAGPQTIGMVLMNHGIFSFGQSARESYERMIALVSRAEEYLRSKNAWILGQTIARQPRASAYSDLPQLRKEICEITGFPVIVTRHSDEKSMAFAQREDLGTIALQGPATPDHVIRTKRLPMIGRDLKAYVQSYREYFAQLEPLAKERKTMLDGAPRVILDPDLGMCTVGRSASDAAVVADIYSHTIDIILRASALGGYRALSAKNIFDVEYWDLEQAKLAKTGKPRLFAGEVVLVTGAASGIGRACVDAFLLRGAAVVGLDINPAVSALYQRPDFTGIQCDVTSEQQLVEAFERTVNAYGGLDMLVLNAGIFPESCRIEDIRTEEWRKVMQINLDSNLVIMRLSHGLLKLAVRGGRAVVIGSKNVAAPGPGAAAYSASKAALNQLTRVAALEWGVDGIRINSLHPNAVFDTGIWSSEVLSSRARHYGLSVDEYKKNNILRTEVTSHDVAELAAEICGPLFAKTTGAQVPIDGGNDRVI